MRARDFFLGLCILGLALPNAAFWPWLAIHGFAPRQFIVDLFANGVSSFFGLDVILSTLAVILFVELTTDLDNLPSQRVILRNGGQLVEQFQKPESHGGALALRFRILLS